MKKHPLPGLVLVLTLSACVLNPYQSEFTCPYTDKGACMSIENAYQRSLEDEARINSGLARSENADAGKDKNDNATSTPEKKYRDALYSKLTGLINDPVSPMVVPPQALEVLILPYHGSNNRLFKHQYVYMFVGKSQWLLDEKDFSEQEAD